MSYRETDEEKIETLNAEAKVLANRVDALTHYRKQETGQEIGRRA